MMRAVASVPPPAPHGTMSVIGRSGQAAWATPVEKAMPAAIKASERRVMAVMSVTPGLNLSDNFQG